MNNKVGVLILYGQNTDLKEEIRKAKALDLESCQLCVWDMSIYDKAHADQLLSALEEENFTISALWSGFTGPCEWNFTYGPTTIGLVPPAYRAHRLKELMLASDFAQMIGVNKVITHVGFIPENPSDPEFDATVAALRQLAKYMQAKGQYFLFETGQETPITMLRTIQAIGTDNLGINFDTANLILYGKANPVDALDVFGKYVMDTHFKDGFYPTDGMRLGREVALGEGKANVYALIEKLAELGYEGPMTIEREIRGEQQVRDIARARDIIRDAMSKL